MYFYTESIYNIILNVNKINLSIASTNKKVAEVAAVTYVAKVAFQFMQPQQPLQPR
jgi:hypothetical protein